MDTGTRVKVLVLGTDPYLLGRLNYHLRRAGYYVSNASGDDERLDDIVRGLAPSLVLIDLDAPAMTGIRTCLRLHLHSAVPTLILSARETVANQLRYPDANEPDHLGEPVSMDEVVGRVRGIIARQAD